MTGVALRDPPRQELQINPSNPFAAILGDRARDIAANHYRGFSPDVVIDAALHASVMNPKILECTPDSIFLALGKVARWGLNIGDEVHLVPYSLNGKLLLVAIPDYKGLKALAYRQRICSLIQEHAVYEHDHFELEHGIPGKLSHRKGLPEERGALAGAWIHITLPSGYAAFHHMYLGDIEAIRKDSKQWNPSKVRLCPPWYAMKTVVRDWLSRQPKGGAAVGSALHEAIAEEQIDYQVSMRPSETQASVTHPERDLNAKLPGDASNFGGWGGKPIVDAPREQLECFTAFCHEKGGRAEKYAAQLALAEERLIEMVAADRAEQEERERLQQLEEEESFPA